jgi:hypothetical protein
VKAAVVFIGAAAALACASPAGASQFIDRGNASGVRLAVNAKGEALLTYSKGGSVRHVLAWGAINARHPTSGKPQVRLRRDYSGRGRYWQTFGGQCRRYDGPRLAYVVAACAAPDGSYWAAQSWQVQLPDLGMLPWLSYQSQPELHLSHWSGPLAQLEIWSDWIYGRRNHHLFGRVTYDGQPVYGFTSTRFGAPIDRYGRLIYLDTFNSRYGKGWRRENSFLLHRPGGLWCYSFLARDPTKGYAHPAGFPSTPRGPGNGENYRIILNGPGVTPDVTVTVPGLADYDASNASHVEYERKQNAFLDSIVGDDKKCRQH